MKHDGVETILAVRFLELLLLAQIALLFGDVSGPVLIPQRSAGRKSSQAPRVRVWDLSPMSLLPAAGLG